MITATYLIPALPIMESAVEHNVLAIDRYWTNPSMLLAPPIYYHGGLLIVLNIIGAISTFTFGRIERLSFVDRRMVEAQQEVIEKERMRAESVLLNILPRKIAERLKMSPDTIVDCFDDATVVFIDIVDFTKLSQVVGPEELVGMLNEVFTRFDHVSKTHGLEKIKTIGDAYMAVSGVPRAVDAHAKVIAVAALEFREVAESITDPLGDKVRVRIGMSSGPVIAGVIGVHKFAYDLWGDTVNTASRMEFHSEPGRILVSPTTYEHLSADFQLRW